MENINIHSIMNDVCQLINDNFDEIESKRYDITIKDDGTPVTNADIFIETIVCDYIMSKFPEAVFVGEETFNFNSVSSQGYIILLDPIDGTENFCSGLKEWGISFGVWNGNTHLGSMIYLPEMRIKLMSGDKLMPIQSRITGCSSSMSESVINIIREPGEYRIMGCAVYNIYNVIRGSFKRFVNPKGVYVWDFLPGVMLAVENGCSVFIDNEPFSGKFLDPARKYRIDIRR